MNIPYIYFLENVGLWIKPLQLHWFTTAFNRTVTKWALWRPRFFRLWFRYRDGASIQYTSTVCIQYTRSCVC